jgi:hypothetical protein
VEQTWWTLRLLACAMASLALVAGAASPAGAQVERGELQLLVTDQTGLAVTATGTLVSEAPQTYRTFETDGQGRFSLQRLAFGVYRLRLDSPGFATHSEIVDVHSAVPRLVRVQLALAPLTSQVEVSSEPPLVDPGRTGVTYAIGAPQIRDHLPAIPGRRLLDLIDAQPGWLMEANGVLHPRGSEYQTLFVVDGIPMDENRSPAFAPDLQDGEIHAVTVLTGNFPAEYGRKLGGVVEVTTGGDIRRGFHGSADVGVGSFGMAAGSFSGAYGWADRALTVGASGARTDRYLDPPVRENFSNTGSLGGVMLSYQDRPRNTDHFQVTVHRRQNVYLVPNELVQQFAGQRQEGAGRETLGHGAWTRILNDRMVLNARGVYDRLSASLRSNPQSTPVAVSADRAFTRGIVNASLAGEFGAHQVKVGGDAVFAPVTERLDYRITTPSFFEAGTRQSFRFSDRGDSRDQSLFVQDTMSLARFTISAGLRWDRYELVVKDTAFSPRLGIAWAAPAADFVLRASYDRVFQTPAIENLLLASSPLTDGVSAVSARLPVHPSRGNFVEGGVTAGLAGRARLDVTAYRRTLDNFADDDVFLNTGVSFPVAFEGADIRGVDSKLTVTPWRRVSGFVSYSLLKGTARLPVVGGLFLGAEALEELEEDDEVPITQDQRHTLRAQIRVDVNSRAWLVLNARYGSGLPVELEDDVDDDVLAEQYGDDILSRVDLESGRVRSNLSFDIGIGAQLWSRDRQRLAVRAEVANLADRLNVINFAGLFSGTALGPPRSAAVRLQYDF